MIILDIETTGIDSHKHSIVSIGALDFYNPSNQFYKECQIWEGAEIDNEALLINGFTREEITNNSKSSLESVINDFISWMKNIENQTFAGENPSFDRDFIVNSARRYGFKIGGHRTIDLHTISYSNHLKKDIELPLKNNRTDLNLDKTLSYVGLLEEPKPHNALVGAKMEAEAFFRLIYGKNLFPEYAKFKLPDYLKK
jgi:DNA polymerase-3 subunit epsilon